MLWGGGTLLAECYLNVGLTHSATLMRLVGDTLGHAGLGVGDRHALARHLAARDHLHQARARQCRLIWHIARQSLIKAIGRVLPDNHTKGRAGNGRHR